MTVAEKPLGRPAVFQDKIYTDLRTRIVSGSLKPNDRIPTRRELCKEFDASTVTIQQAVERLVTDGFLQPMGPRGTFVTATPPHLSRYALVFPHGPTTNRFWLVLANEASRLRHTKNIDLITYYNIDGHTDRREYQELLDDVTHHRLAGLIFASVPYLVSDTPLLTEPGIPRALIGSGSSNYNFTRVSGHDRAAIVRAVDIVKRKGREKVALILPGQTNDMAKAFIEELGLIGINVPPWWIHFVPHQHPDGARNVAHLLARGVNGERPDALIIANDNLVEAATTGLLDSGIRIPEDLLVISHCNFPCPPRNLTPVIRIGHECGEYLEACIQSIDAQRKGEKSPLVHYISHIREEEADASPGTPQMPYLETATT